MKKFLVVATLVLGIFVAQAQVSAQKVYCGMNDYGDAGVYIFTETIRDISWKSYSGFSVQVVSDDDYDNSSTWYFVRKDGTWCILLGLDDLS